MNENYCSESKNAEVQNWTKYKKWIVSAQIQSHALSATSQSILIKRGKGNIIGGIFINYGELHDDYQHAFD